MKWTSISCTPLCISITAENATQNALNVSTLDRQNLGKYSVGPCEWSHSN